MRCPSCDHDNRADRRFCAECGAPLSAACPACGAPVEPGEKFCGGCGARLPTEAPATGAARRPASLSGVAGRRTPAADGPLLRPGRLDAALAAARRRGVARRRRAVPAGRRAAVERFGGHVAKYLGDGLLVYFGWPDGARGRPRARDPRRASRSSTRWSQLNARLAADDGTRLAVRIGMHTGPGRRSPTAARCSARRRTSRRACRAPPSPTRWSITAATQRLVAGHVRRRGPRPAAAEGRARAGDALSRRAAERRAQPPRRRGGSADAVRRARGASWRRWSSAGSGRPTAKGRTCSSSARPASGSRGSPTSSASGSRRCRTPGSSAAPAPTPRARRSTR